MSQSCKFTNLVWLESDFLAESEDKDENCSLIVAMEGRSCEADFDTTVVSL